MATQMFCRHLLTGPVPSLCNSDQNGMPHLQVLFDWGLFEPLLGKCHLTEIHGFCKGSKSPQITRVRGGATDFCGPWVCFYETNAHKFGTKQKCRTSSCR